MLNVSHSNPNKCYKNNLDPVMVIHGIEKEFVPNQCFLEGFAVVNDQDGSGNTLSLFY